MMHLKKPVLETDYNLGLFLRIIPNNLFIVCVIPCHVGRTKAKRCAPYA